jgi:ribonuclease BN (tRNA processing enzyme)
MTMSLTVLGGAAAWPNPGQGCSAFLVQGAGTRILLDCGPNTLLELRRHADFRQVDAIVISHCHSDHILDLVPYRYGLVYGPETGRRRIPVLLPPGGHRRLLMLAEAFGGQGEAVDSFWSTCFDLCEYDPHVELQVGGLHLSFAPTQHFIECYAMRVAHAGSALAYSADTGIIEPLVPLFTDVRVAIVEATLESHDGTPRNERGHLTPEDAGDLAAQAGAHRLMLTHLWSERPDEQVLTAARERFGGEILIAKPGICVHV